MTTDREAFYSADDIDVIYVAGPNALHFQQAKQALEHGKSVIVEKPIVQSAEEFKELEAIAADKGLIVVEAARHVFEPNFKTVREYIHKNRADLSGAELHYGQYSSKFDSYLNGDNPNVFTKEFAGGALNDLGVYLVYAAIAWFGEPTDAHYFPQKLASGVDGSGMIVLGYGDFSVYLHVSKQYNDEQSSEIYFGKHTLSLDGIQMISRAELLDDEADAISVEPVDQAALSFEAEEFAHYIMHEDDYKTAHCEHHQLMQAVVRVMDQLRPAVFGE